MQQSTTGMRLGDRVEIEGQGGTVVGWQSAELLIRWDSGEVTWLDVDCLRP